MEFLTTSISCDFTQCGLIEAIKLMESRLGQNFPLRLIINYSESDGRILETIFAVKGKLDIPFEKSYCLPRDAWMLVCDKEDVIFYSPGA